MTDKIVVLSTCGSEEEAEKLSRLLVDRRLAACVNVIPQVRSFYRWKGRVEDAREWMLVIKTSRSLFGALAAAISAAHSYELPEAIAIPVVDGDRGYLDWLAGNVRPEGEPSDG